MVNSTSSLIMTLSQSANVSYKSIIYLLNVYAFGSFRFFYYIANHNSTFRYLHRVTLFPFHYTIFTSQNQKDTQRVTNSLQ